MSPDEIRNALRRLQGRLADARHEVNLLLLARSSAGWIEEALEEVELRESLTSCMEVVEQLLEEVDEHELEDLQEEAREDELLHGAP